MIQIYLARDPYQAHIVQEILRSKGIPAVIQGERIFENRGDIPLQYPTVWVSEADAQSARKVVEKFERNLKKRGELPSWTCPECGERVDASFIECWRCASGGQSAGGED